MVSAIPNPAIESLASHIAPDLVFAEVLLRRSSDGFELRHVAERAAVSLRTVRAPELRELAQFTTHKQFRPLKSAPTLRQGWSCLARGLSELAEALHCLYPGALADWFAAQRSDPPVTHYREFTARQTGMYRITTMLTDEQVAQVARAGCDRRFCLKRRLWTAGGLAAETAAEKSLIPCLEPCAVLMEFARAAVRIEQREKRNVPLAHEEWETLTAGLKCVVQMRRVDLREADFSAPDNPRRAQLLLEKLEPKSAEQRS